MDKRVSILAVAKKAKCSTATVSNVLNNKGRCGPGKRKAVLRAVKELGYQTSSAGRNLRTLKSEMLGLLFYPSCAHIFRNFFYPEIMEGLEERLTQNGYHLLLAGYLLSVTDSTVPNFLIQGKVDGMILLGRFPNTIIQNFYKVSKPLLLLDANAEWPIDSVISDGFTAEIDVVERLASKGHRNIIMLTYDFEDYNGDLRVKGFLAGLAMRGLNGGSAQVVRGVQHEDIYVALQNRLKSPTPPTAVVTVNDFLAMWMINRLRTDGIRVPEQLSFVGYDDDHVMLDGRPFLSTVRVDKKKLGQTGADLILKRVAFPEAPAVKLRLPTEFVARESVAPLAV